METTLYLFVPLLAIAAALGHIGIWSPRRIWVKWCGVGAVALFIPLSYGALAELLSRPKPTTLEWAHRHMAEAKLVGATMTEGKAIYLWLKIPNIAEPRAYRLPWSRKMAQQLQTAQRQAQKNRNGIKVRLPFDNSTERRENMFYAAPQEALPPKLIPPSEDKQMFPEAPGRT